MVDINSKKSDIIAALESMGVKVENPNAKKEDLIKLLVPQVTLANPTIVTQSSVNEQKTGDDMSQLVGMMSTLIKKIDGIDNRVNRIETGGKLEYKNDVKEADVESAGKTKEKVDERLVKIVEDVLGTDFGIDISPNKDSPGFMFSILVPERLSEVKRTTRPIKDPNNPEEYLLDPKTKRFIEEEYWPGDRRSRAVGSTDSFDLIRDHCNRVRAYIITTYEKMKRPAPEFRLK